MSGTSKDALDGGLYVFEESKKSFKFDHLQSINFSKQYKKHCFPKALLPKKHVEKNTNNTKRFFEKKRF